MAVPSRVQASEERVRGRRHPLRARRHRSPPSAGLGPGSRPGSRPKAVNRFRPTTSQALWDHGSTARRQPPPRSPPPPSPGSRTPDRRLRRPRAPHSPPLQAPPPPPAHTRPPCHPPRLPAVHRTDDSDAHRPTLAGPFRRDRRPRPPAMHATDGHVPHRPALAAPSGPTTAPAASRTPDPRLRHPPADTRRPHLGCTTIARHLGHGSIRRPHSGAAATTRPDQAADVSPRAVAQHCQHSGPTAAPRSSGGAPRPHPYRYCLPSCARPGPLMPRAWVVAGLIRRISAATATTARAMPAGIATLSAWRRL